LAAGGSGGARQHAEISGQGNVVVQIVGDGNSVVVGYAYLTLTRYLNRRIPPGQGDPGGEAALLSPYALSVPLVGREAVLAELWEWMGAGRPVSVRVITAAAGAGKTRLALELCDQAVRAGWDAGFLAEGELVRFHSLQNLAAWGWRRSTLIVVDYAASRARDLRAWLVELADHSGQEGKPLRLLLLERHAETSGGWWREAFGYGGGDSEAVERLLDPASGPYVLPPLVGPRERRAVLSSILERIGSRVRPPELAAAPRFERQLAAMSWGGEPLFLLMAGLIADRADFGAVLALSATDLGLRIARHEIGRIEGLARSRKIPEPFLAHLAAYVTLCQGLPRAEVEALVEQEKEALRYSSAGDAPTIYEALAAALPGEAGAVAPVLPDVVGEAVVLQALGGGAPEKALAAVARAARQGAERVTASVIHLAQDYGAVRPELLAWFEQVAGVAATTLDSLETVLAQLPAKTLVLRGPAEVLELGAVELARKEGDRYRLASHLSNLSSRLSDLGRREEALAAIDEAVAQYRELAASRPDTFRPDLARSLNSLSIRLSALGRREEALAVIEEAVAQCRELAASRPDAFGPDLAGSLNNLSNWLSDLGRREEALAAIDEAVAQYRELAAARPDAFRPDLTMSLNNLSNRLSELGRREEALAAIDEAVVIRRELAASRPDAYRPDLASSLNNLSNRLIDLGRREEALVAIDEAVVIRRDLVASQPDAFRPDLVAQ
jgi:tetratricopeptide (TPR) repeat protein